MKRLMSIAIVASTLAFGFAGCTSSKPIDAPRDQKVVMQAFNDETYVWESWHHSTNKVENVIQK